MDIKISEFIDGAKRAQGLTVIIDVFRSFTVACYCMDNGAEKIIPVGDLELAYEIKRKNPEFILMGERNERIQPGFDFGNSPTYIKDVDFTGKTIIQTTGAGTQGIANAIRAEGIITGSFVNAKAIVNYIKKQNPKNVTLVAMGFAGKTRVDEDYFCAQYIKSLLENKPYNIEEAFIKIRNGSGKRFFDPNNQQYAPITDIDLCLNLNSFDFVLKLKKEKNSIPYLIKMNNFKFYQ